MARLLSALVCMVTAAALGPAAPVPKHLMPRDRPLEFPTRVGTKWVYERNGVEETHVISETKDEKDGTRLVSIERVAEDGTLTPYWVERVAPGGVSVEVEAGRRYEKPWCMIAFPHREGRSWKYQLPSGDGTMTAGPVEDVRVPAGKFSAARVVDEYLVETKREQVTYWFAHGVGLVRMDAGGQEMKLKSFTPGK
jgi:hypothetical protein